MEKCLSRRCLKARYPAWHQPVVRIKGKFTSEHVTLSFSLSGAPVNCGKKVVIRSCQVSRGDTPCITYTKRSLLRKVDCPALNVRPDVPRGARGGACTCVARRKGPIERASEALLSRVRSVPNTRGAILHRRYFRDAEIRGKRNE